MAEFSSIAWSLTSSAMARHHKKRKKEATSRKCKNTGLGLLYVSGLESNIAFAKFLSVLSDRRKKIFCFASF